MKYYHVSWDYKNLINVFVPKVPKSTLPIEDATIPRVSLCKNIYECLNGIGYLANYSCMDYFKKLDTDYMPIRVYEFDLDDKDILNSKEIVKYVPDALRTKEIWSIKEIKPIKSYIILPTYFYQEDKFPYDIVDFEFEDEQSIKELEIDVL